MMNELFKFDITAYNYTFCNNVEEAEKLLKEAYKEQYVFETSWKDSKKEIYYNLIIRKDKVYFIIRNYTKENK